GQGDPGHSMCVQGGKLESCPQERWGNALRGKPIRLAPPAGPNELRRPNVERRKLAFLFGGVKGRMKRLPFSARGAPCGPPKNPRLRCVNADLVIPSHRLPCGEQITF